MNGSRVLWFFLTSISAVSLARAQGQPALVPGEEWERLKAQVAEQREQIQQLKAGLEEQKKTIAALVKPELVATSALHPEPGTESLVPAGQKVSPEAASPLQFHLGTSTITPIGFMDFTTVSRSTNAGTGIGSNFGSIPFANTAAGSLTETKLSAQNSRFGFRVDAAVDGANVLGYMESDFVSQLGNPPNGGIAVSSNSYPVRLRLYWADVRKDKLEFLAGQSWSLITPNRRSLSAIPGDLFFTQDIDVNYQAGLVWARIPGFRLLYHFSPKTAFGVSLENSEPYVGGSAGGGVITPPAGLAGLMGTQLNNGGSVLAAPAVHPDIIAKFAFDPSSKFHIEAAGL